MPHRKYTTSPYKDRLLLLFREKSLFFSWEQNETHKYFMWENVEIFNIWAGAT
jgi:hypothetical protein